MFIRCSLLLATAPVAASSHDCFSLSLTHSLIHSVVIMLNEYFIAVVVHFAPLDIGMNSSSRKKNCYFHPRMENCFMWIVHDFSRQRKRSAFKRIFIQKLLPHFFFIWFCVMCANEYKKTKRIVVVKLSSVLVSSHFNFSLLVIKFSRNLNFFFHLDSFSLWIQT